MIIIKLISSLALLTSLTLTGSEIPLLTLNPKTKKVKKRTVSMDQYSTFLNKNLNRSLRRKRKLKSNNQYQLDFMVIALSGDARLGIFNFYASPSANFEFHMKVLE